jgi:hypothetical protein
MGVELPFTGVRGIGCCSDQQNTAQVVIIDSVSYDLFYFPVIVGASWNMPILNIQDEIKRSNPGATRIPNFMDVSVTYNEAMNELHVYAVSTDNNIYHTVQNARNVWSVFDLVPN